MRAETKQVGFADRHWISKVFHTSSWVMDDCLQAFSNSLTGGMTGVDLSEVDPVMPLAAVLKCTNISV